MKGRKVAFVLLIIVLTVLLFLSYFRFVHNGEHFINPVFESTGNLYSDNGESTGRAGYFSKFPFISQYNTYLSNVMLQRPCLSDSDCITQNCSSYGYCDAQYKNARSTWRTG